MNSLHLNGVSSSKKDGEWASPLLFKQIGDKMLQLICKAEQLYSEAIKNRSVSGRFQTPIAFLEGRFKMRGMDLGMIGFLECPLREEGASCGRWNKRYELLNCENNYSMSFSGLQVHLMRDHGVNHYREFGWQIRPEVASNCLGVQFNEDYSSSLSSYKIWNFHSYKVADENFCALLRQNASLVLVVDDNTTAIVIGDPSMLCGSQLNPLKEQVPFLYLWSGSGELMELSLEVGGAILEVPKRSIENNLCLFSCETGYKAILGDNDSLEWV